jgi:dTDP-glucose 4,6-dehydratase
VTDISQARILVTGGAGFIGQNFIHHLAATAPQASLVVIDALTYAANLQSLLPLRDSGRLTFEQADITDLDRMMAIFAQYQPDHVIHFAAETHVDRSITGPDAFIATNIVGTYNLLKTALAHWKAWGMLQASRFVHVSTDEVFGDLEPDAAPFREDTPYQPSSPYSASKAASDHLARAFCRTFGLPVIVTNCSNNYGPYQHPEKLIPLMIVHALTGKPLPIYGDGLNVRDWLYVGDHCRALAEVLTRGEPGQTFNVGGNSERPNRTVVSRICALIDQAFLRRPKLAAKFPDCPAAKGYSCADLITFVTDRAGHDRRYAIDCSLLSRTLGISPQESFDSGLERTVDWYIDNEAWWRAGAG